MGKLVTNLTSIRRHDIYCQSGTVWEANGTDGDTQEVDDDVARVLAEFPTKFDVKLNYLDDLSAEVTQRAMVSYETPPVVMEFDGVTYMHAGGSVDITPDDDVAVIAFGGIYRLRHKDGASIIGGGHLGALLAWIEHDTDASSPLLIAVEAKGSIRSGTCTLMVVNEIQLSENAGAGTTVYLSNSHIVGNSGPIGQAAAYRAVVDGNSNTIGVWDSFLIPDMSAITGITTRRGYTNLDAKSANLSTAPWVDRSLEGAAHTTGQTATMSGEKTTYMNYASGTLAALTVALPATPLPGHTYIFQTWGGITALTFDGNGRTAVTTTTSLPLCGAVKIRHDEVTNVWFEVKQ